MRVQVNSLLILTVAAFAITGCGWFAEEAAEKAMEMSAESDGSSVDIEIDGDSGEMTFKSEDGDVSINMDNDSGEFEMTSEEGTFKMATGENAEVPSDFPEDIPLYPGFKPDMVTSLPDGGFSLAGVVRADIPAVTGHYEKTAVKNGWKETGSIKQEHVASLSYEKDGRSLQVTATPDAAGTMIGITATPKQ